MDKKKIGAFLLEYLAELVFMVLAFSAYVLLYREWTILPTLLLVASSLCALFFSRGWSRVFYCILLSLVYIPDRHFMIHYSTCIRKAGSQVLITMHITDADEIWTYLNILHLTEYGMLLFSIAAVIVMLMYRKRSARFFQYNAYGTLAAYVGLFAVMAYNVIPPIREYAASWKERKDYCLARQQHRFNVTDTRKDAREFALLIIGESHRYDEYERLFNVHGNDIPVMAKMRKDGELLAFSDMISLYPQTYMAVFTLLSHRTGENLDAFWPQGGLLALFKEAGWHTIYLTYQNMNLLDYGYDAVVNEGNEYINHRHTSGTKLDTGMLPILKDKLEQNTGKLLVVVKMTGCHFHFASPHRYPDCFRRYMPDGRRDKKSNPTSGKPEDIMKMKNAYRNAILFSGTFIDEIFSYAQQQPVPGFVWFLSDHGITNYDDGKNAYFGRAKASYHLPSYLYFNDAFRKDCLPDPCKETLWQRKDAKLSNRYVFDTFATLAGLDYPAKRPALDLTSPLFAETPDRTVWLWDEQVKYDELAEEPQER